MQLQSMDELNGPHQNIISVKIIKVIYKQLFIYQLVVDKQTFGSVLVNLKLILKSEF